MCDIEPEGHCEVWEERVIKRARKRHRCSACCGFIQIGDSYTDHFSVYCGDATYEKICHPCQGAREDFQRDHRWMPAPSSFGDYINDCIDAETLRVYNPETKRHDFRPNEIARRWMSIKEAMHARCEAAAAQLAQERS